MENSLSLAYRSLRGRRSRLSPAAPRSMASAGVWPIPNCSSSGMTMWSHSKERHDMPATERREAQREYDRKRAASPKRLEARREAQRRYDASPKGREVHRRYDASPKGREAKRKSNASPEGREARRKYKRRYHASLKGREAIRAIFAALQ